MLIFHIFQIRGTPEERADARQAGTSARVKKTPFSFFIHSVLMLKIKECAHWLRAADVAVITDFKRSGALMSAFTLSLPARKSHGTKTFVLFVILR